MYLNRYIYLPISPYIGTVNLGWMRILKVLRRAQFFKVAKSYRNSFSGGFKNDHFIGYESVVSKNIGFSMFTLTLLGVGILTINQTEAVSSDPIEKTVNEEEIPKISSFKNTKIFCGNANPALAREIASLLGVDLGSATVDKFNDGEVNLLINENVRGKDVYIIQPTCSPVNENLMELFLMVSTLRRASARRITAVIPYYGYARQDRKMTARVPISAADIARLLEAMGVDRVVAVDLHCGQIQGFFGPRVPVDNLDGGQVGVCYFGSKVLKDIKNPVVVSPDAGGVYRAKKFVERLQTRYGIEANLAMIIKQRSKPGEVSRMDLVGSVEGSEVIIVDDMIDTAGTLCKAAEELKKRGATKVYAFASHGLFSGPAATRIKQSCLDEVVVLNTIPLSDEMKKVSQITTLSVAQLLASAIKRIHDKRSISELFDEDVNQVYTEVS